jgi:hypothetical protein
LSCPCLCSSSNFSDLKFILFSHISAFTCHEHGYPALVYAPHQTSKI